MSLGADMCYLRITKISLILFAMYVHMHLFALRTTCVFPEQNQTQEKKTHDFCKVLLPRNAKKQLFFLMSFVEYFMHWHKYWKWPI